MTNRFRYLLLALVLAFSAGLVPGHAQDEPVSEAHRSELIDIEAQIAETDVDELLELRERLRAIRSQAETESQPLRDRRDEIETDIERLGPPPDEAGIAEAPDIAQRRQALRNEFARFDAEIRQGELNVIEASRLLEDIAQRRREAFYDRIFQRSSPPFTLGVIGPALESAGGGFLELRRRMGKWSDQFETPTERHQAVVAILFAAFFGGLLAWPVRRWIDRNVISRLQTLDPTRARRVSVAAIRFFARTLPAVVGAYAVYEVAKGQGVVTEATAPLVQSLLLLVVASLMADSFVSAVFAPKLPEWRVIPLCGSQAKMVRLLFNVIIFVFSLNIVLAQGAAYLEASSELALLLSAIDSIALAGLLFALASGNLWDLDPGREDEYSEETLRTWQRLRAAARLFSVVVVIAIIVGFVALGRFAMSRVFYLSLLLAMVWFSRALLGELAEWASGMVSRSISGKSASPTMSHKDDEKLYAFWLKLMVDLVLVVTVLPVGALIMGVEWTELRDWMFDALFGFRIGGFTVSFAKIFSAFAVMFFILVLTRFIQRTSDARIFAPARMESGLRNTLRTLIGYAGLILGTMTAIATLGFPLGNLAIVAGALSVGIGFGLQSIVNNFVSGLILLFERPIKVGDWIVTNSGEGIVKRISVRSTEIETWDWASIIVPNSELISSSVINRTHKNRYTRIVVPVGVSYSSDPEEVSGILMKIARDNKRTLNYPAPVVYFIGFGDSSLDFEVRIFINTIDDRIPVQNEIRHAIFKAFREEGIEIPFPQRDLHVRSIEPGSIYSGQLSEEVSGPVIEPAEEPVDVEPVQEEPAPKAEDIWDEEKDPVPSK